MFHRQPEPLRLRQRLTGALFATDSIAVAVEVATVAWLTRINRAAEFVPDCSAVRVVLGRLGSGFRRRLWCRGRCRLRGGSRCRLGSWRWLRSGSRCRFRSESWRRLGSWTRNNTRQRVGDHSILDCPERAASDRGQSNNRDKDDGCDFAVRQLTAFA